MASKKGRPELDLGDMLLKAMIKTHKMNYEGEESRIRAKGWKIYIAGKITGCRRAFSRLGKWPRYWSGRK